MVSREWLWLYERKVSKLVAEFGHDFVFSKKNYRSLDRGKNIPFLKLVIFLTGYEIT